MKIKCHKKVLVLLIAFTLLISNIVLGSADLEGLKEQKKEMEEKAQNQQSEISGLNTQINSVGQEIRVLDSQINESQNQLDIIEEQISELEAEILINVENLEKAQASLDEKQDELNSRLREQYMRGDTIFLEILLESSSIVEILTRFDIVKDIVNQDKELLEFTNRQIEFIEETEAILKVQRKEYKEKLEIEKIKKAELEKANREKMEYMAILQEDKTKAEAQYDEFIAMTNALDSKIVQLEKELEAKRKAEEEARKRREEERRKAAEAANNTYTSYSGGSGQMLWPVSGHYNITSLYGNRIHPIFKTNKFHAGIDISAPLGTSILAAKSGIVIYSGWQGGYGNCVMISHGDGIVTLYGHHSKNLVSVGQYVEAGQKIALCGSTGYSTGPHLHFEVRVNGSTTNPLNWL